MTVDYEMPLGPLGNILDKVKFAKSAENGLETALVQSKRTFRRKWLNSSLYHI